MAAIQRLTILIIHLAIVASLSCTNTTQPANIITQPIDTLPTPTVPLPEATSQGGLGITPIKEEVLPSIADIVEKAKPSVVSLAVQIEETRCDIFGRCWLDQREAQGTGVIITPDGYIATNNHVVADAIDIQVFLVDEQVFQAKLIGRDPASDLAMIKIPDGEYPALAFANPDTLRVGDWVIAIGNALALTGGPTVTIGIVGALDRTIATDEANLFNMIQTDAAINPGNSGGPLIDLYGNIVGINTAKTQSGEGIGFSVNAFDVIPVMESIKENGRVVFAWLGVGVDDLTPVIALQRNLQISRGVLIKSVSSGGPAEIGGIVPGDVIVSFGGKAVDTVRQLQHGVRAYDIGSDVSLTVIRGSQTLEFTLSLEEQPRGL
jgi:S1-C subfamily serine protease